MEVQTTGKRLSLSPHGDAVYDYAAFLACWARTRAHRARCASAILRRAAAVSLRLPEDFTPFFPADRERPRTFAHRAFCASAMRRRAEAEIVRPRRPEWEFPLLFRPVNPSSTAIAEFNLSICECACFRSSRSWLSALFRLAIFSFPLSLETRDLLYS